MDKKKELPYSGVKKNSSFMIDPDLEKDARDFAMLNRISYSSFVEGLIRDKISPLKDSIRAFFAVELTPELKAAGVEKRTNSYKVETESTTEIRKASSDGKVTRTTLPKGAIKVPKKNK